jgi:putative restriction endonuclease
MARRGDVVEELARLSAGSLSLDGSDDRWPARGTLDVGDSVLLVDLFVARVGPSGRGRGDVERRFQNLGAHRPITVTVGRLPLLVGLWTEDSTVMMKRPVVVLASAERRANLATRWSVFLKLNRLLAASEFGWSSYINDAGERFRMMPAELLAVGVAESLNASVRSDIQNQEALREVVLSDYQTEPISERVRRLTSRLVRDGAFARRLGDTYGWSCAFCGLSLGLVQGAHLFPAAAIDSTDEVGNGLPLCANHHLSFDRFLLAVHPVTFDLIFRPDILENAIENAATRLLVKNTFSRVKTVSGFLPDSANLIRRYNFFGEEYHWLKLYF